MSAFKALFLKSFFITILVSLTLVGVAKAQTPNLERQSYGDIDFGSRVELVQRLLGEDIVQEDEDNGGCYHGTFAKYPNVNFMVVDGRIVRAVIYEGDVTTAEGVQIGQTEKQVRKLVSPIKKEKDPYDTDQLISIEKGANFGYVFQLEGGKVSEIRAGTAEAIQYAEGCL